MVNVSGSKMEDDVRQEDHVYDLVECNELRRFKIVWLKANSQRDDDSLVNGEPDNKEIPVLSRHTLHFDHCIRDLELHESIHLLFKLGLLVGGAHILEVLLLLLF